MEQTIYFSPFLYDFFFCSYFHSFSRFLSLGKFLFFSDLFWFIASFFLNSFTFFLCFSFSHFLLQIPISFFYHFLCSRSAFFFFLFLNHYLPLFLCVYLTFLLFSVLPWLFFHFPFFSFSSAYLLHRKFFIFLYLFFVFFDLIFSPSSSSSIIFDFPKHSTFSSFLSHFCFFFPFSSCYYTYYVPSSLRSYSSSFSYGHAFVFSSHSFFHHSHVSFFILIFLCYSLR